MRRRTVRFGIAVIVASLLLGTIAPIASAQSETGIGGEVVVADGETVDSIEGIAGSVTVEEGGTVTGDVNALAGDVRIGGTVEGDVSTAAGNVRVLGEVEGDVAGAAGNVVVAEDATVGGSLEAGAGTVQLDGTVEGDVSVGADTVVLGDDASIAGDLRYGGSLEGDTDAVAGEVTYDPSLGLELLPTIQPFTEWLFALYTLALNLLLGAALLVLFPRFSSGVAERVAGDPVRTGVAGLVALVGVPILLIAIAITVVGIPLSVAGAFLFALVAWIGLVYGRFAVAAWLLGAIDVDNRWLALVVGLAGAAVLVRIPFVGGLLNLVVFLLGLGALAMGLYDHRRRHRVEPRGRAVASDGGSPPAGDE
ncbi:bactofilin family protein [Halopiger goleimassiliensis]|uniref:bactofilin family protein n=1 Tax=Halopiger goleimassiliensis TaxID=1293048 RepID=UPI000677C0B4|nr:polymer-forming cytoskeletal protein [Halopiger goleimassiliensis]